MWSHLSLELPCSLASIALVSLLASIIYLSFLCVYRLYFHPLAAYPGPLLARPTTWHSVYHALHGTRHIESLRTHRQYGPIVRYAPNALSFNTATALKKIYGHDSNVRKSDFYTVFPATPSSFSTHSAIDKVAHARKRRVLSHAFSDAAIKSMERHIVSNIRLFCEGIGATPSTPSPWPQTSAFLEPKHHQQIPHDEPSNEKHPWSLTANIATWSNHLTFDIMGTLCFGRTFAMLTSPTNHFAIPLIGQAAHRHLICGTKPLLHNWHLDRLLFPHISAGRARYMAYSKAQAEQRTRIGDADADRKDFFYHLLRARDPVTGRGFSMQELWGESNLLIIAGSDTTSTALAATLFYLVHNQACLVRAHAEVASIFSDVEDIVSGPKLASCTYIRHCIDEAMRLSPPVPGVLPRRVLPGGLEIDGVMIPAGVDVGVAAYAIHHNETYFPEPAKFDPGRWVASGSHHDKVDMAAARTAFCPFSIGSRGCIGKGLAYTELSITLARLVFMYEMRVVGDAGPGSSSRPVGARGDMSVDRTQDLEYVLKDQFTSQKDGPMVMFRRRC